MYGTDGEQRRYGRVVAVDVAVGEYDVVVAVIHAALRLLAQVVEGLAQPFLALGALEYDGQLHGVEALVAYVAEYVELRVGEYGVRQAHHLAVGLVGSEDACAHAAYVLAERHHQILAYGVDGRVGDLRELLAEVVEEYLRAVGEHGQGRVVAHGGRGLLALGAHRHDGAVYVLLAEAELYLVAQQVGDAVLHFAP